MRAAAPSVTKALQSMISPAERRAIKMADDNYRLTPPGIKYVREAGLIAPE